MIVEIYDLRDYLNDIFVVIDYGFVDFKNSVVIYCICGYVWIVCIDMWIVFGFYDRYWNVDGICIYCFIDELVNFCYFFCVWILCFCVFNFYNIY